MSHATPLTEAPASSPLMLADRLLTLAKDADLAGFQSTANRLVHLAYRVFDEQPRSLS